MTTLIVGLDGASFELIEPWIDDGSLSTIANLQRDGAAMPMQSCLPPVTCPNWQAYATGTNPGKLGVFWWEYVDRDARAVRNTSQSTDFEGSHFWTEMDGQSAVVNLPTSYPPAEIDGVVVSGGPGAEETGYTAPASLADELEAELDYRVHPKQLSLISADSPRSDCTREILDLIDKRFDAVELLLENDTYEFVHLTVFYLNVLQHFFWDHEIVREAWKRIDDRLDELLDRGDIEHVFLMSDHGSNEIERTFHVNSWLEREGYLVTEPSISEYLYRMGITQDRIRSILGTLGIEWAMRKLTPRRLQMLLPDSGGTVDKSAKGSAIDWEASTAVASGQGPVYILAEGDAYERVRAELTRKLEGLQDATGRTVVESVLRSEDEYEGPFVADGPDLLLDQAPGVHVDGKIGDTDVFSAPDQWRGENKRTGLFVASGPSIDADGTVPDMEITDIAPTVLHLLGYPVPSRMDGRVRTELFASGTPPAERDVTRTNHETRDTRDSESENDAVTERLNDLGYL